MEAQVEGKQATVSSQPAVIVVKAEEPKVTTGQVLGAIKEWKEWAVLVVGIITAAIVAWNSKANASDLEAVKFKLQEQAIIGDQIKTTLTAISNLQAQLLGVDARFDRVNQRIDDAKERRAVSSAETDTQ